MTESTSQRRILEAAFAAAVTRCQADESMRRYLPDPPADGRLLIFGAGKATARMAEVAETYYRTEFPQAAVSGLIVIPDGEPAQLDLIDVRRAAHPLSDERSVRAATHMLALAHDATANDRVVVLISGGASALLCAPAKGVTLTDQRQLVQAMFAAGARIDELNAIRKFLSAIKGGRLASACSPAPVTTLAISDVVGDNPDIIGSGPTVPSYVSRDDVRDLLSRYAIEAPQSVRSLLTAPQEKPALAHADLNYHIIARPIDALQTAAKLAAEHGYRTRILGDDIEGNAAEEGARMATLCANHNDQKLALLSGGEVTVRFSNDQHAGYGGPNREFALALALNLQTAERVSALVADTDGVDGQSGQTGPVAGALVDGGTIARASAHRLDALNHLERHDSGSFFESLGDEVITGPTRTNVNDFRMILIN